MELQKLKETMKAEGDLKEFYYEGYKCCVKRGPLGALCGYVALDETHIFYKKNYNAIEVSVHGGLTFSEFVSDRMNFPKSFTNNWVLGFDCAHACDLVPEFVEKNLHFLGSGVYRDMQYVEDEIKLLVNQLIDLQEIAQS